MTRGLLQLQHSRARILLTLGTEKQGKFCTALRQLSVCRAHSIRLIDKGKEIQMPDNESWGELTKSRLAVSQNTQTSLSPNHWRPPRELGLELRDLMDSSGTHMIDTNQVQQRLGEKKQTKHKKALNHATLIIIRNYRPHDTKLNNSQAPLPPDLCRLPPDWVHRDTWEVATTPADRIAPSAALTRPQHTPSVSQTRANIPQRPSTRTAARPPRQAPGPLVIDLVPDMTRFLKRNSETDTVQQARMPTLSDGNQDPPRQRRRTPLPRLRPETML